MVVIAHVIGFALMILIGIVIVVMTGPHAPRRDDGDDGFDPGEFDDGD